jgi:hypothetical protein
VRRQSGSARISVALREVCGTHGCGYVVRSNVPSSIHYRCRKMREDSIERGAGPY